MLRTVKELIVVELKVPQLKSELPCFEMERADCVSQSWCLSYVFTVVWLVLFCFPQTKELQAKKKEAKTKKAWAFLHLPWEMAATWQTGCKLNDFDFQLLPLYTQKTHLTSESCIPFWGWFYVVSGVTEVQKTEESSKVFPMKLKFVFPSLLPSFLSNIFVDWGLVETRGDSGSFCTDCWNNENAIIVATL